MAIDNPIFLPGKQAGADLSSKQYYLVKDDTTDNQVILVASASDIPQGSLYNKPSAEGQAADVAALTTGHPILVIVGSGGVTAGFVGTKSTGDLVNKSSAGDFAIGTVDRTWASGDIATVYPLPTRIHA